MTQAPALQKNEPDDLLRSITSERVPPVAVTKTSRPPNSDNLLTFKSPHLVKENPPSVVQVSSRRLLEPLLRAGASCLLLSNHELAKASARTLNRR